MGQGAEARAEMGARAGAELGRRLRELRLARGWIAREVAEALGRDSMTVYRWEWGAVEPGLTDLQALARLYETTAGYLVAGEGMPPAYLTTTRRGEGET